MGMFYAVAGVLSLVTALVLIRPLFAGRGEAGAENGTETDDRGAREAALYRDQLDEIERDLARGTIGAREAEGARAEVSRRLIGASARAETAPGASPAPRRISGLLAVVALVGAPALAALIYLDSGFPGLPDLPYAGRPAPTAGAGQALRPSQAEAEAAFDASRQAPSGAAEAEYADLIAQLEAVVAQRPDDIDGQQLLAGGYMRLGRHAEAWRVFETLIGLLGDQAEPALYTAQTEAMVLAAGGYVSPEAEAVLGKAVEADPAQPMARYYSGLLLAQKGRIDDAIAVWERLRAEAPDNAPWVDFLDMMLAEAKGMRSRPPGPDAGDVAAADAMTAEERQAMIEDMVARLETRLTSDGGEVEEWLRLMTSYVRLGRMEDARRAYALGTAAFGDSSEAGFLREQALLMGIVGE